MVPLAVDLGSGEHGPDRASVRTCKCFLYKLALPSAAVFSRHEGTGPDTPHRRTGPGPLFGPAYVLKGPCGPSRQHQVAGDRRARYPAVLVNINVNG